MIHTQTISVQVYTHHKVVWDTPASRRMNTKQAPNSDFYAQLLIFASMKKKTPFRLNRKAFHTHNLAWLFVLLFPLLPQAATYYGNPSNYTTYFSLLQPGDSLLLEAGSYYDRMNLDDVVGTEDHPIVISGPLSGSGSAVLYGNACCNTISIERCAYLKIQNLLLDGQDIPYIDAVKAEGTLGNWAHHITIENLLIINHGGAPLTVGISTKCPAWGWVIRNNHIIEPGLGLYLGDSDGSAPFVAGLVEYNLVLNPLRYCMQIKHQNVGTRDVPGMPTQAHTTIRYNVFAKDENNDSDAPRPNLLVGAFPATGAGANDYYEIYGNLLFQNPTEGLFQGTGHFGFYDNLLINYYNNGWGILSFPHNSFAPRNTNYFNNTIYTESYGIEIYNPNADYDQRVVGNAVFSPIPFSLHANVHEEDNISDDDYNIVNYLQNPYGPLNQTDYRPLSGALTGPPIDATPFQQYDRYNYDFEGRIRGWEYRGAYIESDELIWTTALEIRPEVNLLPVSIWELLPDDYFHVEVSPNPAGGEPLRLSANIPRAGTFFLELYDNHGRTLWQKKQDVQAGLWQEWIEPGLWAKGLYLLKWSFRDAQGRFYEGSEKVVY